LLYTKTVHHSCVVALVLVLVTSCARPLDRKKLHAAVKDLRATATETHLVLTQARSGGSPADFVTEQRVFLADRARKAQSELERGVEDSTLEADRRHAAEAARRLISRLELERDPRGFDSLIGELSSIEARVTP
jgi:hypothetical protein